MRLGDKLSVGDTAKPISAGPRKGHLADVIKVEPFFADAQMDQVTVRFSDGYVISALDIDFQRVTAIERLAELSDD